MAFDPQDFEAGSLKQGMVWFSEEEAGVAHCLSYRLSCQHNFQPFLVSFRFVSACLIPLRVVPINTFLLPSHAAYSPSNTNLNCIIIMMSSVIFICIFDEPDLWYGVTDQHHSSMNSVGLTCEHD